MRRDLQAIRNNTRTDWYRISNKTDDSPLQVLIYGDIGDSWWSDSVPASRFVRDLAEIDPDAAVDFHIHSPGGDVFDGLAIASAIRGHKGKTTAYVDGLAASAASYIAIAADEVVMALGAELMIHDAWGFAMGNAADMAKMAEDLEHISANIASLYAARAGGEVTDWRAAMQAETWYAAQEAVDANLADRIDTGAQLDADTKNAFDLSIFAHAGRAQAPRPVFPGRARAQQPPAEPDHTNPQEGADMKSTLQTGIRNALGIPADRELDDDDLVAGVVEALAERADPEPTAALPEGAVAIDRTQLDQLQADAAQGRAARQEQLTNARESKIAAALADGRITAASAATWRATLERDDEHGTSHGAELLASLAKNQQVPVTPIGYTGGVEDSNDDDALYAMAFPDEKKKEA